MEQELGELGDGGPKVAPERQDGACCGPHLVSFLSDVCRGFTLSIFSQGWAAVRGGVSARELGVMVCRTYFAWVRLGPILAQGLWGCSGA
jgi:hypothetical protein